MGVIRLKRASVCVHYWEQLRQIKWHTNQGCKIGVWGQKKRMRRGDTQQLKEQKQCMAFARCMAQAESLENSRRLRLDWHKLSICTMPPIWVEVVGKLFHGLCFCHPNHRIT